MRGDPRSHLLDLIFVQFARFPLRNEHADALGQLVRFQAVAESNHELETLREVDEVEILEDFVGLIVQDGQADGLHDNLVQLFLLVGNLL